MVPVEDRIDLKTMEEPDHVESVPAGGPNSANSKLDPMVGCSEFLLYLFRD